MLSKRYYNIYIPASRRIFCTKLNTEEVPVLQLDAEIKSDIENKVYKPRKHPGVTKIGTCFLPEKVVRATKTILEDHPVKNILEHAKSLSQYLSSRHHPLEREDLQERKANFTEKVQSKMAQLPEDCNEEEVDNYNKVVRNSVAKLMDKYNYKWSALELTDYSSLVYLLTRAAPNYATAMQVLSEIKRFHPEYKPTSLFDFGSGVGSVSWAVRSVWDQPLEEVVNVDSSGSMNELAELLLKGGTSAGATPQGVHYRQFLPAQQRKYSLVVSAHSLMELPSRENRLEHLLNFWNKTEDYLIIIEQGTKPGFKLVSEARDFILSLSENEESEGYVFAPCPHDMSCPRLILGPYPCHFQLLYCELPLQKKQSIKKELFSYVIIRRGRRPDGDNWPRIVRPVLQRHNHVICRLCTSGGTLQEEIITRNRHGPTLYKCAKVSRWGDRLPVNVPDIPTSLSEDLEAEELS